jgi:hypothetical protein
MFDPARKVVLAKQQILLPIHNCHLIAKPKFYHYAKHRTGSRWIQMREKENRMLIKATEVQKFRMLIKATEVKKTGVAL